MRILLLDVELAPNLATVWGVWKQNISSNQLLETSRVMCYAAKWLGERQMLFDSELDSSHDEMIEGLHKLLSSADAVVTYNGDRFDLPVINREFLLYGMAPPLPYQTIDLLPVVRKRFRFVRNTLDHICRELGLGQKVNHEGHELWLKCMDKDKKAWKKMKEYNKHDVVLLERLYKILLPWINNHPNHALYTEDTKPICPNCGSKHVIKNGLEPTKLGLYQRYKCTACKLPIRGRTTMLSKEKRMTILTQAKSS